VNCACEREKLIHPFLSLSLSPPPRVLSLTTTCLYVDFFFAIKFVLSDQYASMQQEERAALLHVSQDRGICVAEREYMCVCVCEVREVRLCVSQCVGVRVLSTDVCVSCCFGECVHL
jgi:hypothetical protein